MLLKQLDVLCNNWRIASESNSLGEQTIKVA